VYRAEKAKVMVRIQKIYHEHHGTTGYRMMAYLLKKEDISLSFQTVHKYMKSLKLRSITRRKKPGYVKHQAHRIVPNCKQKPSAPNKVWSMDFTYIFTKTGMCFNCTIIDEFDRTIVATHTGKQINTELAISRWK